jgi:sRNA-binding carbon storage regulator CsrA
MLCLTIKESECFTIGDNIKIKIIKSGRRKNLVAILAPRTLSVKRVNKNDIIKEPKKQDESARDGDPIKGGSL